MCDACDRSLDRRRFLRHLMTGGALAAGGVLFNGWGEAVGAAAPPFEGVQFGEDPLPKVVPRPTVVQTPAATPRTASAPRIITRAPNGAPTSRSATPVAPSRRSAS